MFELDLKHINTEDFRREAITFLSNEAKYGTGRGFYINAPKGSVEYKDYWNLQAFYCQNGFSVGSIKITGEHYFYLNFCQISLKLSTKIDNIEELTSKKKRVETAITFPNFWDSDWYYFNECKRAEDLGLHMIVLKPRRRGYSYKNAAKCAHTYTFSKVMSNSLILAEDKKYSEETMRMAVSYLDFLNKYTGFGRQRQHINKPREVVQASYEEITADGRKLPGGTMSRIMQYSTFNNSDVVRGKDARVILFEEAGSMSNLKATYTVTRPTVESGTSVSGQIFVYGCVCAGTKVWTKEGKLINIEDLKQEDGIIGYNGTNVYKEEIGGIKPPAQKPCYRIETTGGNFIECSEDHPLLWSSPKFKIDRGNKGLYKKVTFKPSKDIKKGDHLMMIKEVPVFGTIFHPEARIIGLMIGDGNYTKGQIPQLSVSDELIFKYVDDNKEVKVYKHFRTKSNIDYKSVAIKDLKTDLVKHGIYGQVKLHKTLPPEVHTWDEKSICELLGGYYDADGNVYYNQKKNAMRIVLTSICYPLLEQVKYQLLKLGIRSSIVKENRNALAKKISAGQLDYIFRLYINTNEDVKQFKSKIKFLSVHKQEVLDKIDGLNTYGHYNPKKVEYELNLDIGKGSYYIGQTDMTNMSFVTVNSVEFIGMKDIYNLHTTHTNTYLSNGFITKQTGGDFSGGMVDFEEMFYDPDTYGFLAYDNMYDEGSTSQIGYFLPDSYSKEGMISSQGVSWHKEAEISILAERERLRRTTKDINIVDKMICENPLKPSEAMLKMGTNIYPKAEINRQISRIKGSNTLSNLGTPGYLEQTETGKIMFNPSTDVKPILNFPYKPDVDGEGCLIQYQPPFKFESYVPADLYFIVVDPYAMDKDPSKGISKRDSLGAAYVLKRINNFSKPYDIIVAEYVARPKFQDDFNRTLFLLAKYYNAKIVFENDRDGNIVAYARTNKMLNYLEEELTVYDSSDNPKRKLGRNYGVSMSNLEVKKQAVNYFRDWLLAPREKDENGEQQLNLHKIYSIPLLEEILKFSYDGNFDRHSAMLVGMLYKKELLLKPQVEEKKTNIYNDPFFEGLKRMVGIKQTL